MNHLWKTPCLAKTMEIWLVRAFRHYFWMAFKHVYRSQKQGWTCWKELSLQGGRENVWVGAEPEGAAFRSHHVVVPKL